MPITTSVTGYVAWTKSSSKYEPKITWYESVGFKKKWKWK